NGAVSLTLAGESPTFYVASLVANRTNVSVSVLGVAEVAPNGGVVAVSSFSSETTGWSLSSSNTSVGGLQVNLTGVVPVGSARGPWNSSELPEQDGGSLGSATVRLVFHLTNGTLSGSPWTVQFDLAVDGWPWVNATDRLGVVLSLQAVGPISLREGSDSVEERANATGSLVATLNWGSNASVTYADGTHATSTVTSGTSVSSDSRETHVRLLFGGVVGGYPSLYYDPSVSLNPAATFVGGVNPGSGPFGLLGSTGGVVGVAAGLAVVGALGWVAFRRGSADPRDRLARARAGAVPLARQASRAREPPSWGDSS
ncbi:MAG: hypothetical protein ACYDFT_05555, partial [Thermoplasmata archaeon]